MSLKSPKSVDIFEDNTILQPHCVRNVTFYLLWCNLLSDSEP